MVDSQRILVVERDPEERSRLRDVLGHDFDVTDAGACGEAADLLRDGPFDLVLLGGMGECAESQVLLNGICSLAPRPKVILVVTAFTDEIMMRATLLQADGVLRCFDESEVVASVAAHLGS